MGSSTGDAAKSWGVYAQVKASLELQGATRFASCVRVLNSLIVNKLPLEQVVVQPQFPGNATTGYKGKGLDRDKGQEVREWVLTSEFWSLVEGIHDFMQPAAEVCISTN